MKSSELLIDKLMNFYKVATMQDLAKKMDMAQPSISKWKSRNSTNSIKRKCRELGIYEEIFNDVRENENGIKYTSPLTNILIREIDDINISENIFQQELLKFIQTLKTIEKES